MGSEVYAASTFWAVEVYQHLLWGIYNYLTEGFANNLFDWLVVR